ncbi:MAG: prepilin-type N-terminal cleavage/methylation domain-containing protein [Verrucomicrobiota bacterium]
MDYRRKQRLTPAIKGFSLVELLVVIAVVGVIASIAVQAMGGFFGTTKRTKVRQNTQTLAWVFANARACGATFVSYDKDSVIDALTGPSGVNGRGSMASVFFKVSMNAEEIAEVKNATSLVEDGSGEDFRLIFTGQ